MERRSCDQKRKGKELMECDLKRKRCEEKTNAMDQTRRDRTRNGKDMK